MLETAFLAHCLHGDRGFGARDLAERREWLWLDLHPVGESGAEFEELEAFLHLLVRLRSDPKHVRHTFACAVINDVVVVLVSVLVV
eukprot:1762151-Rhodomonas_salina.1